MKLDLKWQLLSVLALLLYAALAVAFVLLLILNVGIAVTLGITSLVLVYALWLVFSGTRKDSKVGTWLAIFAAAGLVIELVYFLSDPQNRRSLLLIIVLAIFYLALFGLLKKKYWILRRQHGKLKGNTANFKNPYLIINPKSGGGRAIKANIGTLAKKQGIHVVMTKKGVDITKSALEAVQAGADVLGISGGDGSIGAVAKVAMEHGLPIVVLPGGTRCHFARDLGLDPKQIVDSLAGFTGVERKIDVGNINGRIFLNNASFGLYADIVDNPNYRENKVQVSRQVLQDIVAGKKKPYDLQFSHKKIAVKKAVQVLVGVNRYNTINLLELGQRQRLDEGVIQVTAVTELNNQLVKQLLRMMSIQRFNELSDIPGLYQWTSKSFVIKSSRKKIVVGVDGEREEYKTPVKVRIEPAALRIYLPAEGVRSRPKNPLSMSVVKKIWQTIRHS